MLVVLIAAMAILASILPVLKRSPRGARRADTRDSRGTAQSGDVVRDENAADPKAALAAPHGPFRGGWSSAQRFTRRARDRQGSQQQAGERPDDYEVEQMVRERLYGSRRRRR